MIDNLISITKKLELLNKDNEQELKKYQIIEQILQTKEAFLEMPMEYAYSILRDLGVPEADLKNVYTSLIEP